MPLSLQQLRTVPTEAQALAFILDTLASVGFRTGSWHDGAVQRNLLTAFARNSAGAAKVVSELVTNLIDTPNGAWLDLLGQWFYRLTRDPGMRAVRPVKFISPPSAPPTVIENGTQVRASGVVFAITGLAVPYLQAPGTEHTFEATADAVGTEGNTGVGPRVVGKGGFRAEWDGDPSVNGADRESDARYLTRCELRFSELTYSVGLRAYEFWALTAAPTVTRARALFVDDDNPIHIILDPGTLSERAQVAAYILNRRPPRDGTALFAADINPQVIKARPTVGPGVTAAQIQALLQAALDSMPIGGWPIVNAPAGRLLREKLTEALLCKGGAQSANVITPAADIVLGPTEIIGPTFDIEVSYA